MTAEKSVLALIPARAGSKGIPHKNIRMIAGKPLIAWSIEQALAAPSVERVVVSTDSEDYARIARDCGAEVPFLRPADIAQDHSTDYEVFRHALDWLDAHKRYRPDICLHLRPTHPVREIADIEAVIGVLRSEPAIDSVRSVVPAPETPFKMWFRDEGGRLAPVVEDPRFPEAYNLPRQALPPTFFQNAALDAVRRRVIVDHGSMTGRVIHGYVMQHSFDIDHEEDFLRADAWLSGRGQRP